MKDQKNLIIVSDEIAKWDPEFLLALGAPEDEYATEIKEIVKTLHVIQDEHSLALFIKNVFEKYFDEKYEFEVCLEVSIKIWNKLQG